MMLRGTGGRCCAKKIGGRHSVVWYEEGRIHNVILEQEAEMVLYEREVGLVEQEEMLTLHVTGGRDDVIWNRKEG